MIVQRPRSQKSQRFVHEDVMQVVKQRLDQCRHGFIFRKVDIEFERGTLKLSGCVPSFYLKQNLQELLRDIPHVERIVNDVDVICCDGLSSVRSENHSQE